MAKANRKPKTPMDVAVDLVETRAARGLDTATPEAILAAGDDIEIGADGVQRVNMDPLTRLYRRGLLHRGAEMNEILHRAGEEYRRIWWSAGLGRSCPSINISGIFVAPAERNPGMATSEVQAHFRGRYRVAREALGFYFAQVVDAVVLDGAEPDLVGRAVSGRAHEREARAVAMDRLSEGLRVLARHFGMLR